MVDFIQFLSVWFCHFFFKHLKNIDYFNQLGTHSKNHSICGPPCRTNYYDNPQTFKNCLYSAIWAIKKLLKRRLYVNIDYIFRSVFTKFLRSCRKILNPQFVRTDKQWVITHQFMEQRQLNSAVQSSKQKITEIWIKFIKLTIFPQFIGNFA